jgi:crossover junction endodeoxyribonuclease RuvC
MLICGIDPGLHRTGYGIVRARGGVLRLVDAGLITTKTQATLPERLAKLHEDLAGLFVEYPDIATVAVEEVYSHYAHPRTAVLMAHARGVLLLAAQQKGISIINVPSTMVKKSVVGAGHASKVQVQRAVMARLNISVDKELPADVTDALAMAICCFEHRRHAPAGVVDPDGT